MIFIDNVPLVLTSDKSNEGSVVLAVTSQARIQQANTSFVNSHLSLKRSLPRTKKCIHVLQNETASVEFEVDDAVLASDDATTCVIAVVVCQATGVASIAHFDELSSKSDLCFRKFMSQHVGGRHCTYDAYLVGGMMEQTLVGYRTASNILNQMNRSLGKFNVNLCCVYDQNTCTQTGCPLVRSFAFDPLTLTAYHVSTSNLNLGLASIHRNLSQHNLQALAQQQTPPSCDQAAIKEEKKSEKKEEPGATAEEEEWVKVSKRDCSEDQKKEISREVPVTTQPQLCPPLSKGKRSASGNCLIAKATCEAQKWHNQHRGPGLKRRLAHYWLTDTKDHPVDLVNVYDTWDQKFVLTGRIHAVPRWIMVNYAYLLTLSDEELLQKTSTTPQYEGENFCSDVRLALNFIIKHACNAEPSFTLYTQSFTWDPTSETWMEVDKYTGKKMKHIQLQEKLDSIHLHNRNHHMGGEVHTHHGTLGKEPIVDVPGSSWSYTSLVDLEKEHQQAAA